MKSIAALILSLGLTLVHTSGASAQVGKALCDAARNAGEEPVIAVIIGKDGRDNHYFCIGKPTPDPTEVSIAGDATSIPVKPFSIQWLLVGTKTCIWFKNSSGKLEEICWKDD